MQELGRRGGFTLIELMAVITVIGLLAALTLPVFGDIRVRSLEVTCASNLKQLGTALYAYAADHEASFPTTGGSYWGLQPSLIAATAPYLEGGEKVWFCTRQVAAKQWDTQALFQGGSIGYYYWAWKGDYWNSGAMNAATPREESPWIMQGWNSELPGIVLLSDIFGDKNAWGTADDIQYHAGKSDLLALSRPGSHLLITGGAVLKMPPRK